MEISFIHMEMNQHLYVNKTKLRTWTHFETEAKGNSEIAYSYITKLLQADA